MADVHKMVKQFLEMSKEQRENFSRPDENDISYFGYVVEYSDDFGLIVDEYDDGNWVIFIVVVPPHNIVHIPITEVKFVSKKIKYNECLKID